MRILITNDDGINAPGLAVLERIASEVAGENGEIWIVAPAFEQSGVGHCISYTRPLMTQRLAERRVAVDGAPADCVMVGLYDVLPGPPDLLLSGVNRGNNAAENVVYSGTLGAAMEGALQGVPSIALSQYYGPGNRDLSDPFEASGAWGARAVRALHAGGMFDGAHAEGTDYALFYNINFPPVPAAEVKGLMACPQGLRRGTAYGTEAAQSPSGRSFVWLKGGDQTAPSQPGSDADANLNGWVSVTPLTADLTARSALPALARALEDAAP